MFLSLNVSQRGFDVEELAFEKTTYLMLRVQRLRQYDTGVAAGTSDTKKAKRLRLLPWCCGDDC